MSTREIPSPHKKKRNPNWTKVGACPYFEFLDKDYAPNCLTREGNGKAN
jgi:hypothetical protein